MEIRGITKKDYDFIVTIIDRWFGGLSSERVHPVFFYELGDQALIAEKDGEIVGFLLGFVTHGTKEKTGYVHLVGIHPDHRRQGVGRSLYNVFLDKSKSEGANQIKAISAVGNRESIRFHEALGFQWEEIDDYAGPGRGRWVYTTIIT